MLFDLNGNTYQVKFFRANPSTVAELWIKDGENFQYLYLSGESHCNPKDRFEKSKGRKIALANLLKELSRKAINYTGNEITKEDRAKIWEIYFKEHKK